MDRLKTKLICAIEGHSAILRMWFQLMNRVRIQDCKIELKSIHFRANDFHSAGKHNKLTFGEKSYMREGRIIVTGDDNNIFCGLNTELVDNSFCVNGSNNSIDIGDNCKITGTSFFICGNNNTIILEDDCSAIGLELHIEQNENVIHIGKGCTFHGRNGYPIHIAADEGSKITVEEDCMFSNGIQIRSSDSHSIVNSKGKRINQAESIQIHKHVWISLGCTVLKGTNIPEHCVVAANSVCTRAYSECHCVYAGNPAKVVKRDIDWDRKFL